MPPHPAPHNYFSYQKQSSFFHYKDEFVLPRTSLCKRHNSVGPQSPGEIGKQWGRQCDQDWLMLMLARQTRKRIPQDHLIGKSWIPSEFSDKHLGQCLGKSSQALASQEQLEKSGLTQGGVSLSEPRNQRNEGRVTEIFVCLSTCLSA